MITGIFSGLAAAFFQDCGYVFSRLYVHAGRAASHLLVFTQLLMGLVSLVLLPFIWHTGAVRDGGFLLPLFCCALCSMGGQYFFFEAEKDVEPARISSLMGLRVVLLAIISALFFGERYDVLQVTGIVLAAGSAVLMNRSSGKHDAAGMGALSMALLFYAVSDLSVWHLIRALETDSILKSSLLAMSFASILQALIALPGFLRMKTKREFVRALPFAGSWFIKQILLYLCYALLGPVFGNVVMA